MKFKKGTRVIYDGKQAKIIAVADGRGYMQYKIFLYDTCIRIWLHKSVLEIDKEFYRDVKINKLLK